jgi:dsDNA-binding SOS-regulon protein
MTEIAYKQAYVTADGKVFETKRELNDYMRKPMIKAAFTEVTGGEGKNPDLVEWLVENEDLVNKAFDAGKIKQFSDEERTQATEQFKSLVATAVDNPEYKFLVDHVDQLVVKFTPQKRLTPEEKVEAGREMIKAATSGNDELANWVFENREEVIKCYKSGKPGLPEALQKSKKQKAA